MTRLLKVCFSYLFLLLFVSSFSFASDLFLEDLVSNLKANQDKIKDMYCEMNTTIRQGTGSPMTQSAKMWTKGEDKSRMEMESPVKQTVIRNGDKSAIIDSSGHKTVNDVNNSTMGSMGSQSKIDIEKLKKAFDPKVKATDDGYIIEGTPKEKNQFLGKMEIYIDSENWVSTKILIYDTHDKVITQTQIDYKEISGAFVPVKSLTESKTMGMNMTIDVKFENVKVNQGISDSKFEI